jgi:hypothetical protein
MADLYLILTTVSFTSSNEVSGDEAKDDPGKMKIP